MNDEVAYRLALIVVVVTAMVTVRSCRRRADKAGEPVSREAEGRTSVVLIRVAAIGLWLSTLAYLIDPALIGWAALDVPASVRWFSFVAAMVGCGLLGWTLASLGENLTDTVATRKSATLVTHGPYRWVRHPYYVAAAILIGAVTLLTANLLIGGCGAVLMTLLVRRTAKEERMLVERFGDAYHEYSAKTGRFWPGRPRKTR